MRGLNLAKYSVSLMASTCRAFRPGEAREGAERPGDDGAEAAASAAAAPPLCTWPKTVTLVEIRDDEEPKQHGERPDVGYLQPVARERAAKVVQPNDERDRRDCDWEPLRALTGLRISRSHTARVAAKALLPRSPLEQPREMTRLGSEISTPLSCADAYGGLTLRRPLSGMRLLTDLRYFTILNRFDLSQDTGHRIQHRASRGAVADGSSRHRRRDTPSPTSAAPLIRRVPGTATTP